MISYLPISVSASTSSAGDKSCLVGTGFDSALAICSSTELPKIVAITSPVTGSSVTLVTLAEVETEVEVKEKIKEAFDKGWAIIVWNDPVNLMSYVAHVFQIVLKMNKEVANRHMLEVHNNGKSVVAIETREQAEFLVHRLQSYGLQATMEVM